MIIPLHYKNVYNTINNNKVIKDGDDEVDKNNWK